MGTVSTLTIRRVADRKSIVSQRTATAISSSWCPSIPSNIVWALTGSHPFPGCVWSVDRGRDGIDELRRGRVTATSLPLTTKKVRGIPATFGGVATLGAAAMTRTAAKGLASSS